MMLDIRLKDGKLFAQPTGQPEIELFAETETRFFTNVVDATLDFLVDTIGRVTVLHFKQGTFEVDAPRRA